MKKIKSLDRLSSLPDSIIHHIFSNLEILEIMDTTSLLSKRWRYLWTSTPFLIFYLNRSNDMYTELSFQEIADRKWYVNFVNRVLLLRDPVSAIHKLDIYSEFSLDKDHLITWLLGAMKRNVKELNLELHLDERFELPPVLFTSGITVFTVNNNMPSGDPKDTTICLPSTICLASRIITLKLEYVKLPEGNAADGELVLSCPSLENLTILSCDDSHLKTLTISAPNLKMLDFIHEIRYKDGFKIKICCRNIRSFTCFCGGNVDISLVDLVALDSAHISISGKNSDKNLYAQLLIKILRGIHNVRALTLSSGDLEEITNSSRTLEILRLFRNLRNITLNDFAASGILSTFAMEKLLKTLPSIQAVVWDRAMSGPGILTGKGADKGQKLPDQSVFSCLETVKIIDPTGLEDEHELKFLEFLLEGATNLKELIITTTQGTIRTEFCQKLLELPRSSSSVSIHCLC